ncbi:NAD(P)-binding protein [Amniculicola lignicola CBS 123094]|uniref:NAD(P)-binding protein n=1 Tax=Amniculicola lignicola CBS 123094 TaxID=1392246 RepID=A0A6A5WSQ5_9PLEO|nr:NAD(P)-binding protein [Amniculicola lignicola CBS 123094]
MSEELGPDAFTKPFQLTKSMHRDVYPAVDPTNPSLSAAGKVVLITGAGGGLGHAIARAWSTAGAEGIVLVGRNIEKLEQTASILTAPTLVATGSVCSEADVEVIFAKAIEKFGKVDTVVNTASEGNHGTVAGSTALSAWWPDIETNLKGLYILLNRFITLTGGKGTFINLISLAVGLLRPGISSYGISKLAASRLGEFIDLEQPEIRYFSIHPGIVQAEDGRGIVIDHFTPFAKDKQMLTGGYTLYLQKPEADFMRGGLMSVNWDVEEMKEHEKEIVEGNLLKLAFLNGNLGPDGHPWSH